MENDSHHDQQQVEIEAKRRFQSFKLGKPAPNLLMTANSSNVAKHQHRRSHSRNASVVSLSQPNLNDNSTTTLPTHHSAPSLSSISSSAAHTSLPSSTSLPSHMSNGSISGKRNSHHRRRSSVSTRTESAEIMGFHLPDLPKSSSNGYGSGSDDDKDSVRRRALWALEGKSAQAVIGFQKVEIPDMSIMDSIGVDKPFEFPAAKPSFPPGSSHRDSFKIKPSSSAKDQLHTLVEEEEEEEEDSPAKSFAVKYTPPLSPRSMNVPRSRTVSSPSPLSSPIKPTYAEKLTQQPLEPKRPRPLSLKPLSLTPDTIFLPTPPTAPPTLVPPLKGLKTLSLASSSAESIGTQTHAPVVRARPVLHIDPEVTTRSYAHVVASSTSSLASVTSSASVQDKEKDKPARRSSISYKSSSNAHGLPTPDQTPTWSERRFSTSSSTSTSTSEDNEGFFRDPSNPPTNAPQSQSQTSVFDKQNSSSSSWTSRPLSASEQHFLFKSHNALLVRIQDLERALSVRVRRERELESRRDSLSPSPHMQTRPLSACSDTSFSDEGSSADAASDELLNMIRDLKAERDELKRDVDGWRRRVGEGEKTISTLSKRVESERREAWVARGRVGVVTQEKEILEKQIEAERQEKDELLTRVERLEEENEGMVRKLEEREKQLRDAEEECVMLKRQFESFRRERDEEVDRLRKELSMGPDRLHVHAASASVGNRAISALFDVDDEEDVPRVTSLDFDDSAEYDAEAEEADEEDGDEDDGLAGYEDEDPLDLEESVSTFSDDDTEDFAPARKVAAVHVTPRSQIAPQQPLPTPPSSGLQGGWKFPLKPMDPPATPTQPQPIQNRGGHRAARSLSMPWSFPRSADVSSTTTVTPATEDDDVDRFFGCLESSSSSASSPTTSLATLDEPFDYERKNVFSSGLQSHGVGLSLGLGLDDESFEEEEEEPFPFELKGVEVPLVSSSVTSSPKVSATTSLDVVVEEDEEDHEVEIEEKNAEDDILEMEMGEEMEMGGIKITFTPPRDDEDASPFSFGSGLEEGGKYKGSKEEILSEVISSQPVLETPPPLSRTASIPVPILVFDEPDDSSDEEDEVEEITFRVPSFPASTNSSSVSSPDNAVHTVNIMPASPKVTAVKASSIPIPRSSSFKFPSTQVTPPNLSRSSSASSIFSPPPSLSSTSSTTPPTSASSLSRSPSPSRLPRLSSSPSTFGGRTSPSGFRAASPSSSNVFITPPTKRGGVMSPSLIPQPSPSKKTTSPSRKGEISFGSGATFIRQPKKQAGTNTSTFKCASTTSTEAIDDLFNAVLNEEEAPATPRASSFSFSPPTVTSPFKSLSSFMPSIPITSLWSNETSSKDKNVPVEKKYVSKEAQLTKLKAHLKLQNPGASSGACGRCGPSDVSL